MELKQIQFFEMVYQQKSFSKAAQELLVTQQCVSKNIQSLEQELGTQLFLRASHGVQATEEGNYFHEQAARILQTQKDILDHFTDLKKQQHCTLQIGVSHGLSFFFDENFFGQFQAKYPKIELNILDLWNPQTEENVLNHTIDAGFTLAPIRYPSLCVEHIYKEPLYCIVNENHPFADRTSLDIEEILDEKIIMANENFNSYHNFRKICEEKHKTPITIKTFDLMSIYEYVRHSNAVGFTLKSYSNILQFQNIRHIPLTDPNAYWDICLVYQKDSKLPLITKFLKFLKEYKSVHWI
jgi:DNA-binding transcriptional LysR family regulator